MVINVNEITNCSCFKIRLSRRFYSIFFTCKYCIKSVTIYIWAEHHYIAFPLCDSSFSSFVEGGCSVFNWKRQFYRSQVLLRNMDALGAKGWLLPYCQNIQGTRWFYQEIATAVHVAQCCRSQFKCRSK